MRDESKASAWKEKGIDIRVGNYDDTDSLDKAMQGIEKVLLIAGTDEDNRLRQQQNIVDAAKKAGVQCIVYTSRALKDRNTLADKLMEGHFQTEDYIKECGLLRQKKHLNNIVEQDHRGIKRLVKPGMEFDSFNTARRTIKG